MALINYKLILLIHSLSAKEIEQFKKFIASSYFTKGRNYIPFLEQVLRIKNTSNLDKDDYKLHISDEFKNFSKQTLRNRYSELYKLGEKFLIISGLENKKAERDRLLLEKLLEKNLFVPYNIKYKETLKQLNHEKYDISKIQNLIKLSELNSTYLLAKNKIDIVYNDYYNYSLINLCLCLLTLFEAGLEFAQQEFNNIKYEPNYVKDHLKKMDLGEMMKSFCDSRSMIFRITSMNYHLYKAFESESDEDYQESHKIFTKLLKELKDEYKTRIFQYLINYCIHMQNKGNVKYKSELFKLYNEKLNQNLIYDLTNNKYLFNHFREYVHIGIELNEYDWVQKFIVKYSPILPHEIRDDETMISYAKLNFAKQKYTKSLLDLENIKKTQYLLYLDSSTLKLNNYYELKMYEEAFLELDKLGHYLRNHKEIPKDHKEYSSNFMNFYRKLLNFKVNPAGRKDPGLLEKEFNEIKFISRKEWMRAKIAELVN